MADVTDSAATSLESALATRTFDDDDETENVDRRQLGVNPDTAPIDASSNTRAHQSWAGSKRRGRCCPN